MFATLLGEKDVDTCLATLWRLSVTAGVGDTGLLSPTLTTLSTYDGHYRCQCTRGGVRCGGAPGTKEGRRGGKCVRGMEIRYKVLWVEA